MSFFEYRWRRLRVCLAFNGPLKLYVQTMSPKDPPPSKEDRLAKALRDNLARRKALVRAKRARAAEGAVAPLPPAGKTERDDAPS